MIDLFRNALHSLRAHKLRFALTSLGIVWGAFMLTYLSSTLQGLDRHFTSALERAGPRLVWLFPGLVIKDSVGERGARAVEFERDDVTRIGSLGLVEHAAPSIAMPNRVVRAGRRTKLLSVSGVSLASQQIRSFGVDQGRFFSQGDIDRAARVAFLGEEAAERLFGRLAVGRNVLIEGTSYRVIGVGEKKGDELISVGAADDRSVFIPYTTAQRWITRSDRVDQILFAPYRREQSATAIGFTREVLALHHGFDPKLDTALTFFNIHDVLQILHRLFFGLRIFLLSAGFLTLFVGGIGVMNIMLVVVRERTQEIGLRKAVGATPASIFFEFLVEAVIVCAISGAFGAGLGVGFAHLMSMLASPESGLGSTPVLDPVTISAFVGALMFVGVIAGVTPALRAARTDPSVALRAT